MTASAAPTNGPTPADMPATKPTDGAPETGAPTGEEPNGGGTEQPTIESLTADRDKWRDQARRNEERAKGNSKKAKEYDEHFDEYKAAWEREQANKTAEQRAADAETAAERRAAEAEARAAAAELALLRKEHATELPAFLHDLITGDDEATVKAQAADVKAKLDAYIESLGAPRRPDPVPDLGKTPGTTASAGDQFAAAVQGFFGR